MHSAVERARIITERHFVHAWSASLIVAVSIAAWSESLMAWLVCALLGSMTALMLMVMAHAPARTVAEIIWQAEDHSPPADPGDR